MSKTPSLHSSNPGSATIRSCPNFPRHLTVNPRFPWRRILMATAWLMVTTALLGAPLDFKWTNHSFYVGPNPSGVAIGPDGTLYLTTSGPDNDMKRIRALRDWGTYAQEIGSFRATNSPLGQPTPTVGLDGTVYFGTYAPATYLGVYSLTPDLRLKWFKLAGAAAGGTEQTLALSELGTIYKGSASGQLIGITPAGVSVNWPSPPSSGNGDVSPIVHPNGRIYYSPGVNSFAEVDSANGQTTYTWTGLTGALASTPAIGPDGTIYLCTLNRVYALNPTTHGVTTLFTPSNPSAFHTRYSCPALGPDGTLYFGNEDNYFYAVDTATGALRGRFNAGAVIYSSPAVAADGTVYFGTRAGDAFAVRLEGGQLIEQDSAFVGDKLNRPVAIAADGTVYVTDEGGFLTAFRGTARPARSAWPMFQQNIRRDGRGKIAPASAWLTVSPSNVVTLHSTVTLTAGAAGSPPFDYEWRKNGELIAGQTGSQLILTDARESDSAIYTVIVGNDAGGANAPTMALTVVGPPRPPVIVTAPIGQTVMAGHPLTLAVEADGTTPFSYQWFFDGEPVPGATNTTLFLESATPAHAGYYAVEVRNVAGATDNKATPALVSVLDLRMFAGLVVAGPTNQWYRLEFTDALASPPAWQPWQTNRLDKNPQVFIDYDSPTHAQRFYRALPVWP